MHKNLAEKIKRKKKHSTQGHFLKHLKIFSCYNFSRIPICSLHFTVRKTLQLTPTRICSEATKTEWSRTCSSNNRSSKNPPPYFWVRKFSPLSVNCGHEIPVLGCVWIFFVLFLLSSLFFSHSFILSVKMHLRMLKTQKKKNIKNWFFAAFFTREKKLNKI